MVNGTFTPDDNDGAETPKLPQSSSQTSQPDESSQQEASPPHSLGTFLYTSVEHNIEQSNTTNNVKVCS